MSAYLLSLWFIQIILIVGYEVRANAGRLDLLVQLIHPQLLSQARHEVDDSSLSGSVSDSELRWMNASQRRDSDDVTAIVVFHLLSEDTCGLKER
jgi:hypothetical protein